MVHTGTKLNFKAVTSISIKSKKEYVFSWKVAKQLVLFTQQNPLILYQKINKQLTFFSKEKYTNGYGPKVVFCPSVLYGDHGKNMTRVSARCT